MRDPSLQMETRVPHHIPGVSSTLISQPLLDSRVPYGRLQHPLTIFPIDQMKSSHVENDYIDSPAVVSQQPASQKAAHRGLPQHHPDALLGAPHAHHHLGRCDPHPHPHHDATTHPWISFSGRPSSISSSSSTSSDQRLLDHAAPTPMVDHHPATINTRTPGSEPKVLTSSSSSSSTSSSSSSKALDLKAVAVGQQGGALIPPSLAEKKHLLLCENCGKCRCTECTLPRALPSCWVCNQECLCSVQSLVDSATCMCLVKGIFYHCTEDEDDEGSCADRPCSCSQSNCCARWSFMAALSLVLPCLVCYLPAMGVAKLSQRCYDNARRPGCRCKTPQQGCKSVEAPAEKQPPQQQQQAS